MSISFCDDCFAKLSEAAKEQVADAARAVANKAAAARGAVSPSSGSTPWSDVSGAKAGLPVSVEPGPAPLLGQEPPRKSSLRRRRWLIHPKGRLRTAARSQSRGCQASCEVSSCLGEGWIAVGADDLEAAAGCPVDKDAPQQRLRRLTGGMQTFMLQCGQLLDWSELYKGESLQLVYACLLTLDPASECLRLVSVRVEVASVRGCVYFLLLILFFLVEVQSLRLHDVTVAAIFYDNACKLLSVARSKRDQCPPWTQTIADTPILLDALHRNNHSWCLVNLPEVDCQRPENKHLVEGANTQVCEEFNRFLADHTPSALEMTRGRYHVYWWSLFRAKNARLLAERDKLRARFRRGFMHQSPDEPLKRARQAGSKSRA